MCEYANCTACMRTCGQEYNSTGTCVRICLTIYSLFIYRNSRSVSSSSKLWDAVQYDQVMKIDHFKWHAGVLNSMRDRMELYRGDCKFGSETLCKPNYPSWKEAAVTYNTLK